MQEGKNSKFRHAHLISNIKTLLDPMTLFSGTFSVILDDPSVLSSEDILDILSRVIKIVFNG